MPDPDQLPDDMKKLCAASGANPVRTFDEDVDRLIKKLRLSERPRRCHTPQATGQRANRRPHGARW